MERTSAEDLAKQRLAQAHVERLLRHTQRNIAAAGAQEPEQKSLVDSVKGVAGGIWSASAIGQSAELMARASRAGQQTYTVQPGDTLWAISIRFYGDGSASSHILEANPQIGDGSVLHPGQTLSIPESPVATGGEAAPSASEAESEASSTSPGADGLSPGEVKGFTHGVSSSDVCEVPVHDDAIDPFVVAGPDVTWGLAGDSKAASSRSAQTPAGRGIAEPAEASQGKRGGQYTVEPGDTLSAIAARIYGDSSAWTRIRDANPQVGDGHLLQPGQTLQIPLDGGSAEASSALDASVLDVPCSALGASLKTVDEEQHLGIHPVPNGMVSVSAVVDGYMTVKPSEADCVTMARWSEDAIAAQFEAKLNDAVSAAVSLDVTGGVFSARMTNGNEFGSQTTSIAFEPVPVLTVRWAPAPVSFEVGGWTYTGSLGLALKSRWIPRPGNDDRDKLWLKLGFEALSLIPQVRGAKWTIKGGLWVIKKLAT